MAKYSVVFSCGHEETVELFGKTSDREKKIEWMKRYAVCSECYQQQKKEAEEERKKGRNLPDLEGTPKQVAWAEKIRDAIFTDWEKIANLKDNRAVKFTAWLRRQDTARFWIDNRDKPIRTLANEWRENEEKLDVIEASKDLEVAAKEEATIYPENHVTKDVAEIDYTEKTVEIESPKNEIIIETVKAADYKWEMEKHRWCLKVTPTRGSAEDRAAEIGNLLLNAGIPIRIYDENCRKKAIAADFAPQKYQWVLLSAEEEIKIFWRDRQHSLYDEAKQLPHAKYREGTMRVPSRYFAEIREFAKLYDLGISEAANELLNKEEQAYKDKITISPGKTAREGKKGEKLKEILKSSRDVLEDLRDED